MDSQSPFTSAGPYNATYPIERSSLQFCDSPLWDTALLWNTETPRYFEMRDLGPSCFSQFHTVLRDHSAGLPPHLGPPPPPPRRLDHPLQKCCQRCKFFAKTKKIFQICHSSNCRRFPGVGVWNAAKSWQPCSCYSALQSWSFPSPSSRWEPFKHKDLVNAIFPTAQCAFCKVRCHCIFYGPGIRYSGIFCVPCISSGYSDIFWHISVVDTVAYFGGNHGSRVWKSLKLKKVYFPRTRTSWDKYMFNRIVFFKF